MILSQVGVLKVGVPDDRSEPFAPQGEAPGFEFPPSYGSLYQGRVYGKIYLNLSYLPFKNIYLFLFDCTRSYLRHVGSSILVAVCGIVSCGM